jgi:hypothetical protein
MSDIAHAIQATQVWNVVSFSSFITIAARVIRQPHTYLPSATSLTQSETLRIGTFLALVASSLSSLESLNIKTHHLSDPRHSVLMEHYLRQQLHRCHRSSSETHTHIFAISNIADKFPAELGLPELKRCAEGRDPM